MDIQIDIKNFIKEYEREFAQPVIEHVESCVQSVAIDAGNWARANAPWNDQSGLARASTVSYIEKKGDIRNIIIGIGAWYGRFLELAHGGRFRIVEPAFYHAIDMLNTLLQRKFRK